MDPKKEVNSGTDKIQWETPIVVQLDIKRINQQMDHQEMELMNFLATDENAFRLLTGSAPSDYRLKEDVQDFSGLDIIRSLKVYEYAWKANGSREHGVMAHELQIVLPYLVSGKKDELDENGNPMIQRVNYAKMVPILLKSIQNQQEIIVQLKEAISKIKQYSLI